METSSEKNIVVGTRIKASTYILLQHLAEHTRLRKGTLIRAAITQWLQNAPEDLPLNLKVEITRANMQHQIEIIKNIRWTYHQARQAHAYMKGLIREQYLPPHTQKLIEQLEQEILALQQQFDQWLKQTTFHTLRHWKATNEYHKTHDPKHVQALLGHRSSLSTDRYITIEQAIFNDVNDEFHVKVASTIEEATGLLEVGFEYVTDMDGKKLFRKRK